jgi:hypothetical protein
MEGTAGAAALLKVTWGAPMLSQLTERDFDNYGPELIDMTRRAAVEALSPELQRLHAENQHLRHLQQRQQHVEIERALDRALPDWRAIYSNPAFSQWLSMPDEYGGTTRSHLLRAAVQAGDTARVIAFYRGFHHAPAGPTRQQARSRSPATGGRPIYTREQIKRLYDQRRHGGISDANWAKVEADIIAAGREGRVTSSFDKYGKERRLI